MRFRRIYALLILLTIALLAVPFRGRIREAIRGDKTVASRLNEYGPAARERWTPYFESAGIEYPPKKLVLVGLKLEETLRVYAAGPDGKMRFIRAYPILGASGDLGPKLREGDGQVPEGLYRIDWLNPNSAYHLSLHLTYPNSFDREMAWREGRRHLGGDIMIHGSNASIGCLAMGDEAAEDLFVLAADTGLSDIRVILSPLDFRTDAPRTALPEEPAWVKQLYREIEAELKLLPLPAAGDKNSGHVQQDVSAVGVVFGQK